MTAFIVICSIALYTFIGSALGRMRKVKLRKECSSCREGYRCYNEHFFDFGFFGGFWPLAIMIFGGSAVGDYIANREDRQERKKAREKAKHDMKMKELNAQLEIQKLTIQTLKEYGVNAEVPGLEDALQPR